MSWVIYALLSAFFASLVAIFGKVGIANVDTTIATTVRAIMMALFLAAVSLGLGKWNLANAIGNKALFYIALSGIAGALSWLCYFFALKTGPAPSVAAIDRLSVVFVLVFALLLLGDYLTWKTGVGAALVTAGAVLMAL